MPHSISRPVDHTTIHKNRRKVLNKPTYKPLPKKKREWTNCEGENCAICKEGAGDGEIAPLHRLTCFGTYQCNHVFHQHCIEEWIHRSRTCPVCRSDGNIVGAIEEKGNTVRQLVTTKLEGATIPWVHAFHGFFKLAHLKINEINFVKTGNTYNIQMDLCPFKNCKSKKCAHVITDGMELLDWMRKCPDEYARKKTPQYIAKRLLIPALMEFAPHIYEHLCELSLEEKYKPVYRYSLTTT